MISNIIYLKEVLNQTQRLLSLLDRNPLSKTYGCFDRQFWHYNTSDFACARSQESILTLALLYKINHDYNIYYNKKRILDWINAGLIFWTKIQENNGSFNEWYPKENSFVATAFSLYAISETILQLKEKILKKEEIISSIKKAGNWLLNKNEKRAQNQEAGAAISLYNVYLLTDEKKYRESSENKINFLINHQTDEGWFYEYGGADIGYLSLSIDYLAKYYQKTCNEELLPVLEKAIDFINYFILPDYSSGGEYGSRNTEYLIPSGFEILSKKISMANVISTHIKKSLENKSAIFPFSIDDRYLSNILYTYLQAYLNSRARESNDEDLKPKYEKIFSKIFSDAGMWIYSDKNIYLIANYKKGGLFKLFFKDNKTIVFDSGIILKTIDGTILTSNWLSNQNKMNIYGKILETEGYLSEVTDNILTPSKNVLLRMFGLTLGRSEKIGLMVKERLRNKLIESIKHYSFKFFRRISVGDEIITIIDKMTDVDKIDELIIGLKTSYIYVPSSRYFQITELNYSPTIYNKSNLLRYENSKEILIARQYNKFGELIKQSVSGKN